MGIVEEYNELWKFLGSKCSSGELTKQRFYELVIRHVDNLWNAGILMPSETHGEKRQHECTPAVLRQAIHEVMQSLQEENPSLLREYRKQKGDTHQK